MPKLKHKRLVLYLFTLSFFLLTPFLVFFSLGYYGLDLDKQKLTKALTIRIETIPRSSEIWVDGRLASNGTPFEVKVTGYELVDLEIRKDKFLSERFLFRGPGDIANLASPFFPFWLLPKDGVTLANFTLSGKSLEQNKIKKTNFNILKQEIFWVEEFRNLQAGGEEITQVAFIQNYSLNGLRKEIETVEKPSTRRIENLKLKAIGENCYWDKENYWLLLEKNNKWILLDLQMEDFDQWELQNAQLNRRLMRRLEEQIKQNLENILPNNLNVQSDKNQEQNKQEKSLSSEFKSEQTQVNSQIALNGNLDNKKNRILSNPLTVANNQIVNIVRSAPNQFVVLDIQQNLWALNLDTLEWQFLASNIQGLSFSQSPNNIWLLSGNKIYKLPNNFVTFKDLANLRPFRKNLNFLKNFQVKQFSVKDFAQGLIFQFEDQVWFNEDSDNSWQMFASGVLETATSQETLFWLDRNYYLYSYNNFLKEQLFLGQIDSRDRQSLDSKNESGQTNTQVYLHYDESWKRLFIYLPQEVWTLRIDKDLHNQSVVVFFPQKWLDNHQCWRQLNDRFQFCLHKEEKAYFLKVYYNNHLW